MKAKENFRRIDITRKVYTRGKSNNFKRYPKKVPKFIRDNPENKIAREKEKENDVFDFTDSESDDDLGMGIGISDIPYLCDDGLLGRQSELVAITQDSVRPLFSDDEAYQQDKVHAALQELLYSSFRPSQEDTIKRILMGKSTLFVSPTGSGKSLCYQLPALLYWRFRKYITIVVSPLISLMEDQINNFPSEIRAVSLHSGQSRLQRQNTYNMLTKGEAQVVFMSPEAIVSGILTVDDLRNLPPVGFVCIDEAHCLCEWSHNFRPAYLQFFQILHDQLAIKTYLALTATSTRSTSLAIANHLKIDHETGIIGFTEVPKNLILSVSTERNKEMALIELLQSPTFRILSSIIIYCNRREDADNLASSIRAKMQRYSTIIEAPAKINPLKRSSDEFDASDDQSESKRGQIRLEWDCESYHAGISFEKRKTIQRKFIKGEIRVIVATIAFGMGINKSNVRAVIHYDMPSSFESYVQEIGRAGRDGKTAQCHMFLSEDFQDLYYQQRNIYSHVADPKNLKKLVDLLFPVCRCFKIEDEQNIERINKFNEEDHHYIDLKTGNTNKASETTRQSDVRKHRICSGHEVAFPIEDTIRELNLEPESIITLIHRLSKAYPQLQIELFTPLKQTCKIVCGNGPKQMSELCNRIIGLRPTYNAYCKQPGSKADRIVFDIMPNYRFFGKSVKEFIKCLKSQEEYLDKESGRYKKSQIRVSFKGHSFHLRMLADLTDEEKAEIHEFLKEFSNNYVKKERQKLASVYAIFKRNSISLDKMGDKKTRLDSSDQLKLTLNNYFQSEDFQQTESQTVVMPTQQSSKMKDTRNTIQEELIRRRIKSFISTHGIEFSSRTIARILQGISTPNYPATVWGTNRLWWRTVLNIDFEELSYLAENELIIASSKSAQERRFS